MSEIDELEESDERDPSPEVEAKPNSLSDIVSDTLDIRAQLTDPDRWIEL